MHVRPPVVAGTFYPADAETLRTTVEQYLDESGETPAPERVAAVIAPHAGYPYSGPTAAHAFARMRGAHPKRIVLLGRSHRYRYPGVQIMREGAYATPLGELPIDAPFAEELVQLAESIGADIEGDEAHYPEHGLEVELPFIQAAVGDISIVPVLFGSPPERWHAAFGAGLAQVLSEEDIVVVSTDLSHYLPEREANALDQASLDCVLSKDYIALAREDAAGHCALCGATAVVAGMACALERGADDWRLLDYRTSGAASGDFSRVVGYGAVSMERAA